MENLAKKLYLDELSRISPCTEAEAETLIPKAVSGDTDAISRLIEGNLFRVAEAAGFYDTDDSLYSDLVQEGNLALIQEIHALEAYSENYGDSLDAAIAKAMQNYRDQEEKETRAAEELKTTLNVLDEVCVRLSETLGTEPTAEEVGEKMKMDPEDVKYLMRIALSAVKKET